MGNLPAPMKTNEALQNRVDKLTRVLDLARELTSETNLNRLLGTIVQKAREVLEADRCTLWIIDHEHNQLWTRVAHEDQNTKRIQIPLSTGLAGKVARTGEIINLSNPYQDPGFNPDVDQETGYTTHSILTVPMQLGSGDITGVLQALNPLDGDPFTEDDANLLFTLGANSAAAIENSILHTDIDQLFEGFVKASVTAIESRDPTTSGHSERVARFSLSIAKNTARTTTGPYRDYELPPAGLRELRYAALLHDFGKVGVRENVLVKAKKLYPWELEIVEARFHALKLQRENRFLKAALLAYRNGTPPPEAPSDLLQRELSELDEFLEFIRQCNEPTILPSTHFDKLSQIETLRYRDLNDETVPLISPLELARLKIPQGSLDEQERLEIESHVTHTFQFLQQIPWPRSLQNIPSIALGHHEKLDGSGYPNGCQSAQIPPPTRMMTIADIYDALTARDRPYKKAVSTEKALDILNHQATTHKLDRDLLDIFIESKGYLLAP